MKKYLLVLLLASLIAPGILAQKTVIGTVDYKYRLVGEGAEQIAGMMPEKMVIKYGKNGMAIEMIGGMMTAMMNRTIVNGKTNEVFVINDAAKAIYLMNEDEIKAEADKAEDAEVEKQEETREIGGYKCTKYLQTATVQGMTMTQVVWVTKDLKTPDYEGDAFKGVSGQGNMSMDFDGFPMLVEVELPGMPVTLELEISNITFEKIPDAVFEKPEGYTVKDFSELNPYGSM